MTAEPSLTVDVVSDVVCPWCYIGKRHLESALAQLGDARKAHVRWHPFELNPDLPSSGVDRKTYLERKFGGPQRAATIYARVKEAGERSGLAFDFDAIVRQPNTRDAHRLIAWVQASGDADALVERLFRAYFLEGRDLTSRDTLIALAGESGVDGDAARGFLASDRGAREIEHAQTRARELGITGVPFFVFDGRVALSGAQPPETIVAAIQQAEEQSRRNDGPGTSVA
ncbi:MAG TPA: DsbA family oxidoreductase [Casimicrobiaceae bacterium]|nr:DsbA family oxidoreductase [Casimicrobiaceae bacterium]